MLVRDADGACSRRAYLEFLGIQTNNFAEYSGLLAALDYALKNGHRAATRGSDSELMVKQIQGKYKLKRHLRPLFDLAQEEDRATRRFRNHPRPAPQEQGRRPPGQPGDGPRHDAGRFDEQYAPGLRPSIRAGGFILRGMGEVRDLLRARPWGLTQARMLAREIGDYKPSLRALVHELFGEAVYVRKRAADVARRITDADPAPLHRYADELAGLLESLPVDESQTRWHLALVVSRTAHTQAQRLRAARIMSLND